MSDPPGHDSGHPFDWAAYVDWLASDCGSLAEVAERLAAQRGHHEQIESIARALRRLRAKGSGDGGSWGLRCLRQFGIPSHATSRVRWMGQYHSRFSDLPVPVCQALLWAWDRPPISASPARVWIQLGLASVALRRDEPAVAKEHLRGAEGSPDPLAAAEHALVLAFVAERDGVSSHLEDAEGAIRLCSGPDRACLWARLVDQRGYELNVHQRDHESAYALYASLPADGPPFAIVRRHNGLGWSAFKLGRRDEAIAHARLSVAAAGDGGYLRLRAMSLKLLARTVGGDEGQAAGARASAIAERLEDETLRARMQ